MKTGLPRLLEQIEQSGDGLTDGQLLARFVAARDEASFAALLRRHGPLIFGVCRRVLHDFHDAEDAFQATFLILARKAASVVRRESLGCWLHQVAYHTALEAARANAGRKARERQERDMPQPEAPSDGATDWRPLLDRELNHLSEKYRQAIVLCDLEGRPQREAAKLLGVATGTLCSRLARARSLLAKRLAARGVTLSVSALAAVVAVDAASAQVPAALAGSTVRVAALVAAGQLTAASTPAVLLMKGVMKAMLMNKLRAVVGTVMVVAALGTIGFACRFGDEARAQPPVPPVPAGADPAPAGRGTGASGQQRLPPATEPGRQPADPSQGQRGTAAPAPATKPQTELEALREENDYLKRNIRVLLDRIKTLEVQQEETPHPKPPAPGTPPPRRAGLTDVNPGPYLGGGPRDGKDLPPALNPGLYLGGGPKGPTPPPGDAAPAAADPLLREVQDQEARERAIQALEKAIKELRKQGNPGGNPLGR